MEKNCLVSVGVVITHDRDVVELVGLEDVYENVSVYFNDDPFGVIEVSGFENISLTEIESSVMQAVADGLRANMYESCRAIIKVEDGYLIVKDIDDFDYVKVESLGDVIPALASFEDNKCTVEYVGEIDFDNNEYATEIVEALSF